MGTHGLDGVLLAWRQGAMTSEQAIGQILQLLQQMEVRLRELERVTTVSGPSLKPAKRKQGNGAS